MADTISGLVDKVYVELGDDGAFEPVFPRRLVVQLLNRGIGTLAARGVRGTYWEAPSVTLTATTSLYTYTAPAHTDSASLTTTLRSIGAVRRGSDGIHLPIRSSEYVEALIGDATSTGAPQCVAFYVTGEVNSIQSTANAIKVLVYPAPASADLPETLQFMLTTSQSMRFTEARGTETVAFEDGAERALVLLTASSLLARSGGKHLERLGLDKAVAVDWRAEAGELIRDEAMRLYTMQLPDDIVEVEA